MKWLDRLPRRQWDMCEDARHWITFPRKHDVKNETSLTGLMMNDDQIIDNIHRKTTLVSQTKDVRFFRGQARSIQGIDHNFYQTTLGLMKNKDGTDSVKHSQGDVSFKDTFSRLNYKKAFVSFIFNKIFIKTDETYVPVSVTL